MNTISEFSLRSRQSPAAIVRRFEARSGNRWSYLFPHKEPGLPDGTLSFKFKDDGFEIYLSPVDPRWSLHASLVVHCRLEESDEYTLLSCSIDYAFPPPWLFGPVVIGAVLVTILIGMHGPRVMPGELALVAGAVLCLGAYTALVRHLGARRLVSDLDALENWIARILGNEPGA